MSAGNRVPGPAQILRQIHFHLRCRVERHRVQVRIQLRQQADADAVFTVAALRIMLIPERIGLGRDWMACLSRVMLLASAMLNQFYKPLSVAAAAFVAAANLLGVVKTHGAETQSKLESDPQGWVDILPSADLKGWYRVPVPPTGQLGRAQWYVDAKQKLLICDGDGGHDMLLFDKEIGDAVFHFEFRYTKIEGKTGYNSGAYVRNSKDGAIWHQAQIGDASGGYLFGETPGGDKPKKWFSLDKKVVESRVKPAGEWNTLEITAAGKVLTLWVNGAVTCQFENCGAEQGRLGLEGEGYRIEFRNLKLKTLR